MNIRLIGLETLDDANKSKLNLTFAEMETELTSNINKVDVIVDIDGLAPQTEILSDIARRNGLYSFNSATVTNYTLNTTELYNHVSGDIVKMQNLDKLILCKYIFYTFWYLDGAEYKSWHKSELGTQYLNPLISGNPNFVRVAIYGTNVTNNFGDGKSIKANRVYSLELSKYGVNT